MKIVMEKNRTRQEIREALREVYEQVAEAAADALMFDFEAESLEVEDYLAFDRDGVWGLDWSIFDEEDFKRWEKELRKTLIKADWRDEDIEEAVKLFDVLKVAERTERKVVEAILRDRVLLAKVETFIDDALDEAASGESLAPAELRTQVLSREEFAKLRDSKVVKERNLTQAQYMSSRYYSRKYGPLETAYVFGSDKLYKTARYAILALKPE
ncbi:MAG: hypothetical protein Q4G65_06125 [bacterium]|nr:hypothetical protein [bacterium]